MVATLIDLSNYSTHLKQSAEGRSGTPTGNIYFDVANGKVEIITREELAQIDFGSGLEDNPLTNQDGIKFEALYAFENQERRTDENLRKYDRYFKGTFKFGGAYEIINNKKFADNDRSKIRGSGWIERDNNGNIGRIYYGVKSLGNIYSTSQPYYQLEAGGIPTNFAKAGAVDEAIQVYGDNTIDSTTTTFDKRTYMSMKVRTFGNNYDEKILDDSGVAQMDGYNSGFALGESPHLTTGDYALADVYGANAISPFTGLSLEKLATPVIVSGFKEGDATFTWILHNTENASLSQCVAFLDALAQTDDDIDSGDETVTNGKRVGTWYTYNGAGQIVTRSGADNLGLFIENMPVLDEQSIVFTADDGTTRARPFNVAISVSVGSFALADANAWYHCFYLADYNTASAVTVTDRDGVEIKGNVQADNVNGNIEWGMDYDSQLGSDTDVVMEVEGDGTCTSAKTVFTITKSVKISASCEPGLETNT
jgi:hypothetical protein